MFIEMSITVAGALLLSDSEEDAPLITVEFTNDFAKLTDEAKFMAGRAMLTALGADSLADAMQD